MRVLLKRNEDSDSVTITWSEMVNEWALLLWIVRAILLLTILVYFRNERVGLIQNNTYLYLLSLRSRFLRGVYHAGPGGRLAAGAAARRGSGGGGAVCHRRGGGARPRDGRGCRPLAPHWRHFALDLPPPLVFAGTVLWTIHKWW